MSASLPALPALVDDLRGARPYPIIGDGMSPTFRPYRDVVFIVPCTAYRGEGVYAVSTWAGAAIELYRVQPASPRGVLQLFRDNKLYSGSVLPAEQFADVVVGKVRGRMEFFDPTDWSQFVETLMR